MGSKMARRGLAGLGALAFAGFGAALFFQHAMGMQPCAWCILQRMVLLCLGTCAWIFALAPGKALQIAGYVGVALLGGAGVWAAASQAAAASSQASCMVSWAEKAIVWTGLDMSLPQAFEPTASCAEAKAVLAGLPFEWVTMGMFGAFALAGLACAWKVARRS